MTTLPPTPSLSPATWLELRQNCAGMALEVEGSHANPIALMGAAKVLEGFMLHGDIELAYRYAGYPSEADAIAKDRASGKLQVVPPSQLPENVSSMRPKPSGPRPVDPKDGGGA